jgi:hypothetical protein
MKVQEKELDQKVIDKLNQFENLKAGYSPDLGGHSLLQRHRFLD